MADFTLNQSLLAQARAARAALQADAAHALEEKKKLQAALDQLNRTAASTEAAARRAELQAGLKQVAEKAAASKVAAESANQAVEAALEAFATFTDPRRNVGQLSDRTPFLLLPLRVETKFVASLDQQQQLWVRIYPDDCSIDTFEATLSETELANAKLYWQNLWSAGGVENGERAAWRSLVTAHGSGRAAWIVDQYQPANLAAKPSKTKDSDEILVIGAQTALAAAEASAISAYWQAVWLASDDNGKVQAAAIALGKAVGAPRAAQLTADYQPFNLSDKPAAPQKKTGVALSTAFVVFPPDPATKASAWSQAPRVNHLADRFVVIGYNGGIQTLEAIGGVVSLPLYTGPDPSADPSETIHPQDGELFVPDELAWLVDFDRAVAAGMGLRIPLTAEQARTGFERLLVVGLQLSAAESEATSGLEELLNHHHYGRSGLSILPQGTPSHNSTGTGAGFTKADDADQTFDDRKHYPLFTPVADPLARRDGDWLTGLLGIDPALFAKVHGSDGQDQIQARAMNCALWPATLGYWMDKMLTPVFSDAAVENTRWFFTSYVSGRGALPALRIGGQPYGILPTTAFSRIGWLNTNRTASSNTRLAFLAELATILTKIGADWSSLSKQASFVGKPGDAHQLLLDIVGLHPASVEFHSRYAETLDQLFNIVNLWGLGPDFWKGVLELPFQAPALGLLAQLGYTGAKMPDILQQIFLTDSAQISNVIDDRPLSESQAIRPYTDDQRNYIQWLIDAARTSLDAVYQEQGFSGGKSPEALLYLFLRHAVTLGYYDSSYFLHRTAAFLSPADLLALKPEPAFVHVAQSGPSESRFAALYKTEPRITSSPSLLVSDYITRNLTTLTETSALREQLQCLQLLAGASTAALERTFAEHIDCCSYRHDAWLLGLVNFQLQAMRAVSREAAGKQGVYLGAYAWLQDLKPSTAQLLPVQLPPDLAKDFTGPTPLRRDLANGGYVHAPSLPHAQTAAVLRSGYLANATPANPSTMAVNLSSDRVRLALSVLEGIRNGQSFGALLGYQFERGLHDDHGLVEVDKLIYPMRKAFPLAADAIASTQTAPTVSIEAIEARNVMDGMKLVTAMRAAAATSVYPFGKALPSISGPESDAVNTQANRLVDLYDSIADLALAEGVHQAVQGNFDRIGATLDAYTTGHFPPDPEVVQTPARGTGLTQRVAIHLQPGLAAPAGATPRAIAEPALDAWLASLLPPLNQIACLVTWADPLTASAQQQAVTLADLAVRPIDLLSMIKPDDIQSMNELDDRILAFVLGTRAPRSDAVLRTEYMNAAGAPFSVFQVLPLLRSLLAIMQRTRPLRATDAKLHNDASPQDDDAVFVDSTRITVSKLALDTLVADITAFLAKLAPLIVDPPKRPDILAGIDGFLNAAVALLVRAAAFNIPSSGWGFALDWKRTAFADLMGKLQDLVTRWDKKLLSYNAKIAAYDALPADTPDDLRFKALRSAQADITNQYDPEPATPALLRAVLNGKLAAFTKRLAAADAVRTTTDPSFANLLASASAIVTSDLDPQPFDVTEFGDRAVIFATDMVANLTGHHAAAQSRGAATQQQLDTAAAAASNSAQVDALQAAAKALLGSDFQIYPEFSITTEHGEEWANTLAASTSGALTSYLTTIANVDFPVDEWLYGIARVRPNMRSWEQLLMLAGAFGLPQPALTPAQFPFEPTAPWLALPFPQDYKLVGDHLLYTAHYAALFDKSARQCGILLDEWTEVIPATDRDTGIAFNFHRPENEAPQSFLLVTPASASGAWQWADLLGALNETLDLVKTRAVEPVHLAGGAYARFLPATVMAATLYGISITTTLAASNGLYRAIGRTAHA